MKYIMFRDFSGQPVPIIFPERIGFGEMREQMPYAEVISAGRVALRQGEFVVHGKSGELGSESRLEDAEIILEKLTRDFAAG
ncbi:MAG: hypothetical protein D6E12_13390 [Desulfovibrio sp.]|nr:MAG: hypothetical protein D6E12_13390 [Desulfovibrio sp.]